MKTNLWRVIIWFPLIMSSAPRQAPTVPIVLPVPPGITLHATNTHTIRDYAGVYWAATRASTSIGGVVWRVDGYKDAEHPGVITFVLNDPFDSDGPDPTKFFGNGELAVWDDGFLYYTTTEVDDIDPTRRNGIATVSYPVQGWTPAP